MNPNHPVLNSTQDNEQPTAKEQFALVWWTEKDVHSLMEETEIQLPAGAANEILEQLEESIQEAMIIAGWRALRSGFEEYVEQNQ